MVNLSHFMPFFTPLQDLFVSSLESLIPGLVLLFLIFQWDKFYRLLCVALEFLFILCFLRDLRKFNVNV